MGFHYKHAFSQESIRKFCVECGHARVATTDLHLKFLEETLFRVSPIIREAVEAGRLEVVVAKYFLRAGQVQPLTSTF